LTHPTYDLHAHFSALFYIRYFLLMPLVFTIILYSRSILFICLFHRPIIMKFYAVITITAVVAVASLTTVDAVPVLNRHGTYDCDFAN
jgi:hypothetical protein